MITRQSFGGTLKLRESAVDMLQLLPEDTCYLVAEWKDESQPPEWMTSGSTFCWRKEHFIQELHATADRWDGDNTAEEKLEAARNQDLYRSRAASKRLRAISNACDRMRERIDTISDVAIAFFFSPSGWPEVTEFWICRPNPSTLIRGLAAALQATQEGAPK